jgi:hypothetical protein
VEEQNSPEDKDLALVSLAQCHCHQRQFDQTQLDRESTMSVVYSLVVLLLNLYGVMWLLP